MTAEKVVGAKYVVTGNSWGNARVGTLVTLEYDDGSDMPCFTLPDGNTQWIPMQAVVKLIVDGDGTVKAEAEDDYWWYTAEMIAEVISEPEFDCPELVAGQVYVAVPYAYFSNEEWLCRYFPYKREVAGSHTATFGGSAVSPEENFHIDGFLLVDKWRKATAEETAKLEAAEKEHGYVPSLVNKVGTVIEAGKYYVLTGSTGRKYICKIESTNSGQEVFYKNTTLVELAERAAVTTDTEYTDLESIYGKSAVPATGKQIALYDAAVALREAQKALKEAA